MQSYAQKLLFVPVFLGLVGCAGASGTHVDRSRVDPLFRVATVDAPERAEGADTPVSARGARAFGVETRLARPGGGVLTAPRLTVYAGQRANVTMANQTAYVETFEVQTNGPDHVAEPIIGVLESGIVLEMCVAPEGDDASMAYRVLVSDLDGPIPMRNLQIAADTTVTIQLPRTTSSEVAGVRLVTPGVWTRVATLGTGAGEVDLHVRVVPADVVVPDFDDTTSETFLGPGVPVADASDYLAAGGDAFPLTDWLRAAGDDLRVDVDALVLAAAAPLGEVFEGGAADRYGAANVRPLRSVTMTSRYVPGASMRVSLDEAYVANYDVESSAPVAEPLVETLRSGIQATFLEGRELALSWVTSPEWHSFETTLANGALALFELPDVRTHAQRVPLEPGSRIVTLARTADGGTLALRVSVATVQRRVASQTQATMNRLPSVDSAR